jgi:hypothetical protein
MVAEVQLLLAPKTLSSNDSLSSLLISLPHQPMGASPG